MRRDLLLLPSAPLLELEVDDGAGEHVVVRQAVAVLKCIMQSYNVHNVHNVHMYNVVVRQAVPVLK